MLPWEQEFLIRLTHLIIQASLQVVWFCLLFLHDLYVATTKQQNSALLHKPSCWVSFDYQELTLETSIWLKYEMKKKYVVEAIFYPSIHPIYSLSHSLLPPICEMYMVSQLTHGDLHGWLRGININVHLGVHLILDLDTKPMSIQQAGEEYGSFPFIQWWTLSATGANVLL